MPARHVAIRIAKACSTREVRDDLLALALNQAEDAHVRACAVSALETCGDETSWAALKPLALGGAGNDSDHDIRGNALALLWPNQVDASELFQNLAPPRDSYFGAYANFLAFKLAESLMRDDLPAALAWATNFVRGTNHMGEFQQKKLADAILRVAWDYVCDPKITPLIVAYVQVAIQQQYELFVGSDRDTNDEFRKRVAEDEKGRRAFVSAAIAACPNAIFAYSLARSSLLTRQDLIWLLSICPGGDGVGASDVDEAILLEFVRVCLDLSDDAHFAALYDAAERWPLLRSNYALWFDGVDLESPTAAQLKEQYRLATQPLRPDRPPLDPAPAQRVHECLDRFDKGEIDAWKQLNADLTLTPASVNYDWGLQYRIALTPGWAEADEETRSRILSSALRFLELAEPSVDLWIGGAQWNYREIASDLAAYRALVLLREFSPVTYQELDSAVWRKWAPAVVALPQETGTEKAKLHNAITADAIVAAPDEIAATVLTLVRSERRRQAAAEQPPPDGMASFLFLRQLNPLQESQPLTSGLLGELADGSNTPQQFADLLDFLLRAKIEAARDIALRIFEVSPCPPEQRLLALSAATTLLEANAVTVWPQLWRAMTTDPDFCRELFLRVAHHNRLGGAPFNGLSEADLGELYVLLENTFPHASDPSHEGAHYVGPRESVIHLRDGVLNILVHRGTPEAVVAIRAVIGRLPKLRWLAFRLLEADQLMRQRTWTPLKPGEVLRLVENPDGRLVQSAEQLAAILVAALRKYEVELHGEQTPVRDLWDFQSNVGLLRPVGEDALSDHVTRFLRRELQERGIVLNREVEISRVPGAPVGTRTDIRVNAIRKSNGEACDSITAVIETKGCWNQQLMNAIETQLHDDYLSRLGAPVGIYLVGWFDKAKWDANDTRRARTPSLDVQEAQRRLDAEAARLSGQFLVRAVVLDCHAP